MENGSFITDKLKILVTGAAGFIGSHAAERLADLGYEVIGIDNFSDYYDVDYKYCNEKSLNDKGVHIIKSDLKDYPSTLPENFNYIIHFSAQPGISENVGFNSYLEDNFIATEHLLEFAARNLSLKMFINISTSSVYGFIAMGKEDSAPAPASFYGVTKLAAEQLVLQYARNGSIPACSLRLFSVYGPRERPDKFFSRLIDCAIHHKPFPLFLGSENHTRSFTYVKDIVDGVVAILGSDKICNLQVINLGSTEECSTLFGIECIEKILGETISIIHLPARSGDQWHTRADITKARHLVGYNPRISLLQGLREQVIWYRQFQANKHIGLSS